jgi:hypothetical protein
VPLVFGSQDDGDDGAGNAENDRLDHSARMAFQTLFLAMHDDGEYRYYEALNSPALPPGAILGDR